MPPSKLDKYLNILEVLMQRPQKIDKIAHKTHMELPELMRRMNFLVVNGVVEKRRFLNSNQAVYALSERGFAVLKSIRSFKYFERLKESMPIIDEAREIASLLQRVNRRKVE
jgi:predicted transcriptional regulator